MSPLFNRDEMRNILRAKNVGEGMIDRVIAREFGDHDPGEFASVVAAAGAGLGPAIGWPITITLPWTALCSDNFREEATLVKRDGKTWPRKTVSARYRGARDKAAEVGRRMMLGMAPFAMPLELHARVWVPDERLHDVCNFAKCCHDAFERVIYSNDKWLYRVTWERAGVDVDAPRAEIEIRPMVTL